MLESGLQICDRGDHTALVCIQELDDLEIERDKDVVYISEGLVKSRGMQNLHIGMEPREIF